MKNIRQTNVNIHRDSWVEINVGNLAYNAAEFRKHVPADTKLLAVVKADSYGHGSIMLAPTLLASGFDMLGVASIDEGVDLRNAKLPVIFLFLEQFLFGRLKVLLMLIFRLLFFQKSISKPANRLMKEQAGNLRFI